MFYFFGPKTWGILAPQPGIKLAPYALEGGFDHWTSKEVSDLTFIILFLLVNLDFVCSLFLFSFGVKLGFLLDIFLILWIRFVLL